MKLGEALNRINEIGKEINILTSLALENGLKQDGDSTERSVENILLEINALIDERSALKYNVMKTNIITQISYAHNQTMSLAEAILLRRSLIDKNSSINSLIQNTKPNLYGMRSKQSEIKVFRSFDPGQQRKIADAAAKQARELDTIIQIINWSTEI